MPNDGSKLSATGGIATIRRGDWQPHARTLKHVFLVGNLQRPVPHPFLRRSDVEVIFCEYEAGDNGLPHWHAEVDEIELVVAGKVGYRDIASGESHWFETGDLLSVPRGVCVERIVSEPSRTVAIKLPSLAEKIHCRSCDRICAHRRDPFQN